MNSANRNARASDSETDGSGSRDSMRMCPRAVRTPVPDELHDHLGQDREIELQVMTRLELEDVVELEFSE